MGPRGNSRNVLIAAAAELLRTHGFSGTGVAEIVVRSGLPKGSLYHHFPGGKAELAAAATRQAADLVRLRIEDAFAPAGSFAEGVCRLCEALVAMAARQGTVSNCPVAGIAQAGAEEPLLRELARSILAEWTASLEAHGRRLGASDPEAQARLALVGLQGAWTIAAIEGHSGAFDVLSSVWRGRGEARNAVRLPERSR